MPTRVFSRRIRFTGIGIATDLAPEVRELTHFTQANNVIFQVSGSVRKVGGSQRLNGTGIAGAPDVVGMFDFWRSGTSGTSTQQFVMVDSTGKIYRTTFALPLDISGSVALTAGARPVFAQFRDLLTIWSSADEAPRKWNQTGNAALLAGNPPAGHVATVHKGRLWAANTNANPSRLTFSALDTAETWTGTDTGSIDVDPEDGDRIVGLASHKGQLLIFKGPNKGSIHQLSGSAPTGNDAFSRQPLLKGIALQTHNSIVEVGDDLWFMSDRGIHSLSATQRFGNFAQADLSRYLKIGFAEGINRSLLDQVWGVHYAHKSCVIWTIAPSGVAENTVAVVFSYIRQEEEGLKVSIWNRSCISAAIFIDPTTKVRQVAFGTTDGFAERQDIPRRGLASAATGGFILNTDVLGTGRLGDAFASNTAYNMRILTPQITITDIDAQGQPRADQPVTLQRMYLKSEPLGDYNVTIDVSRDGLAPETYLFNQGSGGFVLDTAVLNVNQLGGGILQTISAEMLGEARSISLDINQGGAGEDAHLYEIGIDYIPTSLVGSGSLA